MKGRFGDLVTAMVTPFDGDGQVNLDEAKRLASWLIDQGSEGLVVTGSTGESPTLSDDEKLSLYEAVVEAVGDRASVIAGTGTYDTAHTVGLTRKASELGVDAALIVTPYYNRPPQEGLYQHFTAAADAADLPVILYDVPSRTARQIDLGTIVRLSAVPNIVGIKDAVGDAQGAARVVKETPEDFQVYSGNDGDTLPWLSVGAVGVISVAAHVVGPQMAQMIKAFKEGDETLARKIHLDLVSVFDAMFIDSNPIPVKAAMGLKGFDVGAPRLPLVPLDQERTGHIREVLEATGSL